MLQNSINRDTSLCRIHGFLVSSRRVIDGVYCFTNVALGVTPFSDQSFAYGGDELTRQ